MGENSKIPWTHHTFNPWIGCTKIAPECRECYAAMLDKLYKWNGGTWGIGAPRTLTSESYWQKPFGWDRRARAAGERARVFAASLADLFDDEAPNWPGSRALPGRGTAWLADETAALDVFMHEIVAKTEHLDWLLLTKRFDRALEYLVQLWNQTPWKNTWVIFSAGTQPTVDRAAGILKSVPATIRGLSMEPLLEPVRLGAALDFLDWVIIGGESGPHARDFNVKAALDLVDECREAKVAVFVKQLGARPIGSPSVCSSLECSCGLHHGFKDKNAAADMAEWPARARVREFPQVVAA